MPAPLQGERALYKRAISRTHAEWPLVEICARAVIKDGTFQFVRLAAGGIAPVPLRLVPRRSSRSQSMTCLLPKGTSILCSWFVWR